MIPVVKPYLPDRTKVDVYVDSIYETNYLTNNGPLVQELTGRLAEYLGINSDCLVLVANGSLALQLAYKALELSGDVITTPFSFIATASTLKWEGLNPVFVDIDKDSWNIDPRLIEQAITPDTSAIVPVHVFGNPCDVESIQRIADKHNLKVVYDAAHCFDTRLSGESILNHGDISTLSFHATKLFHTVEGGAVITKTKALADKVRKMINFGLDGSGNVDDLGTNAKMSEFHAAVGLAVLNDIEQIKLQRKQVWSHYELALVKFGLTQKRHEQSNNNFSYFPIVLESECEVLETLTALSARGIQARRYFYPSLDSINGLDSGTYYSISRDVASRIICLPIWPGLSVEQVNDCIQCLLDQEGIAK
jgi:dTDP-4-amino-4,6-dideoxygalactose transaminase